MIDTDPVTPSTRPGYFAATGHAQIERDYPMGNALEARYRCKSRAYLRDLQNQRFLELMAFAWRVPFYRRRWTEAGVVPSDIRSIDDLVKLPTYSKQDLMASVERFPPFGDFHGLDAHGEGVRPQLILQTTSGTTGTPQPLMYGPRSREIQNILLARAFRLQGMNESDIVHSMYGFGMVNGGHYIREAITHWVGASVLSAGTGLETRSVQQVRLMRDFRATALVGFADYAKKLAQVAVENGIVPGKDIRLKMISGHVGEEADRLREAWGGCDVFDWYGVGDTGIIAAQTRPSGPLMVFEDAHLIEIVGDDGRPCSPGAEGDLVCTCLFKDDIFPIIRFNTHDVSRFVPEADDEGYPFRRIAGFLGRSDNMVKLRGVNVYPTGIGAILEREVTGYAGDYLCVLRRVDGRDEMTLRVELKDTGVSVGAAEVIRGVMKAALGVEIDVEVCPVGALASLTGIESRQKPVRLLKDIR